MVCIVAAVQGELLLTRLFILFLSLRVTQASIHVFVPSKDLSCAEKVLRGARGIRLICHDFNLQ